MDSNTGINSSEKALQEVAKVIHGDKSPTEIIKQYDNWSSYDETMSALKFKGHTKVADAVVKYLSGNKGVSVLDVASGTGIIGVELNARGFDNIDALDPSEGMLNAAREKNVYTNFIQEFFPDAKSSLTTSSYDVLTVVGGMAEGHMKCDCLPEMVRCVKPGGLVVISVREDYLSNVDEYKDRLEPLMKQLETDGEWKILERTVIPNYYHTYNGVLFVLKVTKSDK